MLTFISADYYYPFSMGQQTLNVFILSDGTVRDCRWGVTWPVPIGNRSIETLESTVQFESEYSGFFNLNNCQHAKVSGTVIARPGYAVVPPTMLGLFGPLVGLGGKAYTSCVTSSPTEVYAGFQGRYANSSFPVGQWWFGAGVTKIGNVLIGTDGGLDLKGSKTYFSRYTSFYTFEYEYLSATQFRKRSITYSPPFNTGSRISESSPLNEINRFKDLILLKHESASWSIENLADQCLVGDKTHILKPQPVTFSSDSVFPISDRNPNWGALANKAYQSVEFFRSNGIALVGDLTRLKADLESTKNLLSVASAGGATPSIIAKIFLAFYYGWRLLVLDLKGVSSAAHSIANLSSRNQKCSANATWEAGGASYTAYFHCYYERFGQLASKVDQLVSEFGLELNLSNIWDMIPFSFVVDWFINIGDLLNGLDSYYRITQEHNIVCTGKSIKCRQSVDCSVAGLKGWLGSIDTSLYIRKYSAEVTYPQFSFSTPTTFNHYVEGTALIVSRH